MRALSQRRIKLLPALHQVRAGSDGGVSKVNAIDGRIRQGDIVVTGSKSLGRKPPVMYSLTA
ncbi:MAG: hypothetical protein IPN95_19550 [Bacteroidetes bacterium]|nr:hypothetical protein [Bacteroidota bacterium]